MLRRSNAYKWRSAPVKATHDSTNFLSRIRRFRWSAVAICVLLCCFVPTLEGGKAIATRPPVQPVMYVFGDSLSDTGNLFNRTGAPTRPYVNGRFSNGLLWDDRLANQLQTILTPITSVAAGETPQSINFAFGGATTGVDQSSDRWGLQQQVSQFRQQMNGQAANPNAVFWVWAGANNYLSGQAIDVAEPIADLRSAIETLIAAGARHLVVANLPRLGQLPATRNRDIAATLDRLTDSHNQQVQALVAELGQDAVSVRLLDVNDLFQRAIAGEFGFTNVTEGCFDRQTGTICPNPDQYLFWDGIHPTTAAHARISEAALPLSAVAAAIEPESKTPPVLAIAVGGGVLAVGALAWMKKR